ncbi:MAG: hypothetical protein AAB380_08085 [Verrucomicrobiota bacterium]
MDRWIHGQKPWDKKNAFQHNSGFISHVGATTVGELPELTITPENAILRVKPTLRDRWMTEQSHVANAAGV